MCNAQEPKIIKILSKLKTDEFHCNDVPFEQASNAVYTSKIEIISTKIINAVPNYNALEIRRFHANHIFDIATKFLWKSH